MSIVRRSIVYLSVVAFSPGACMVRDGVLDAKCCGAAGGDGTAGESGSAGSGSIASAGRLPTPLGGQSNGSAGVSTTGGTKAGSATAGSAVTAGGANAGRAGSGTNSAGGAAGTTTPAGGTPSGGTTSTTTWIDPRTQTPGSPDPNASLGCTLVSSSPLPTTYCRIQNNGFDRNGNPQADVGDTSVWLYWELTSVSGWICINDDQANGRGLNYRVLTHNQGTSTTMPGNAFIDAPSAFSVVESGQAVSGSCNWASFKGSYSGGIDFVVIEWEDRWVSAAGVPTTHYDGRSIANSPLVK